MADEMNVERLADDLRLSIGLLVRRLRKVKEADDDLPLPQAMALSVLDRSGPQTGAELARHEQISPQAMAATLAPLEAAGLIERARDPADGRRAVLSLTAAGRDTIHGRRSASSALITEHLQAHFTAEERAHLQRSAELIDRLARSL